MSWSYSALRRVPWTLVGLFALAPELPAQDLYPPPRYTVLSDAPWHAGAGMSLLPNVGLTTAFGKVVSGDAAGWWGVDFQLDVQPIDDKSVVDDGNPEAGDFYSMRLGLEHAEPFGEFTQFHARGGLAWFDADGDPNWVGAPGDWYGIHGGIGFTTEVAGAWSVGPGLSLLLVNNPDADETDVVPMFQWTARRWFGRSPSRQPRAKHPVFEAAARVGYVDDPAVGFAAGQVLSHTESRATSFELDTVLTDPGSGDLARLGGSFKVRWWPDHRSHPVLRLGVVWLRTTAPTPSLETEGDYVGLDANFGWEFDLGDTWFTGPSVGAAVLALEGEVEDLTVLPQASWYLGKRF